MAVARHDVHIPFGVIRQNEDGTLGSVEEKPTICNFIAAGIYFLSPEYRALVPKNKPVAMPDLLNMGKQVGLRTGLFPIHEYWTDVGNPDDLDAANRNLEIHQNDV